MLDKIRSAYHNQMFFPGFFGVFVNPFYFARKNIAKAMQEASKNISGSLLDVGCGTKPYIRVFNVESYRGLDIDSPITRERGIADDLYDGTKFPYVDSCFNSALCNQVLEHVFNPDEFLLEINRVLKPGGVLLLTVPFVWDEHEQPFDYARYSTFGLRDLLEKSGFKIIEHKKLGADATIIFQLTNTYLYKLIKAWPRFAQLFFTATVVATVNVCGIAAGKILPKNPDLFLDHVVLAEKV